MELLVRGTARAERELVDAIAREARVRVAVDEARDRRQPATVDLLDVVVERSEVAHPTDCLDPPAFAEHVGVVGHGDVAQCRAAERGIGSGRAGDLREVADEEPPPGIPQARAHAPAPATDGRSIAYSRAEASASS